MRYALAVRRRRRRERRAALVAKLSRLISRSLAPVFARVSDPAQATELRERSWCAILGIPYDQIVPGSLDLGARRYTVTLAEPLHRVVIEGQVAP